MSKKNTGGDGFIIALIVMAIAGALKASGKQVSWWWIILPIPVYIAGIILFVFFLQGFAFLVRGG